jgi:crotonobetainyl-CoA:carnitine CoA-transferase CaiB-like acyl-CoA transferase
MTTGYRPLDGVRVLDVGILIPPALTSAKLVALGADVVKVEQPPRGDRIRSVPPYGPDGESPQHMAQNWGKRSIALDLRDAVDRETFFRLAERADVILENQLAGSWQRIGIDLADLRARRPSLVICSITGFGQTGPYASLPSHGLNMDALADTLNLDWTEEGPRLGWTFTSWGNELGSAHAALAIVAALLEVRSTGEGAWIDISCWDALVEAHRTELALTIRSGEPFNMHENDTGEMYNAYLSRDGKPFLMAALEGKFWANFCHGVGREDLLDARGTDAALHFAWGDETLRRELVAIFATATAEEWDRRFQEWDVPGSRILQIPEVMELEHFEARAIVEGPVGSWPNITSAIRWHHRDERAGSGLTPPPGIDEDRDAILAEWLAEGSTPAAG